MPSIWAMKITLGLYFDTRKVSTYPEFLMEYMDDVILVSSSPVFHLSSGIETVSYNNSCHYHVFYSQFLQLDCIPKGGW